MQVFSSSTPEPGDGGAVRFPNPGTGPSLVPPPRHEERRSFKKYGLGFALVLVAGMGLYWDRKAESALAAKGHGISVPVTVVSLGNVTATVRVVGTVAAM